jgi:hypothetical protein
MTTIPQDAYTFLCRFARRHKRKAWSPEQAIGQAALHGIAFGDDRHWGPVFRRAASDGVIRRAGLFQRATSNRSTRPGWIGAD